MLSAPILTVKVPLAVLPPVEAKATAKVVSPWLAGASEFTGSTVKTQPVPVEDRVTVILVPSTPVASPQVMVLLLSASVAWDKAFISKVRFRPTFSPVGATKVIVLSGPTLTVTTPLAVAPPSEENGTVKVALPCKDELRVLIGVIVKEQLLAVRVTEVSLVLSMLVASPQVIV